MRLDRAWIEGYIPHQGSMCLLDEVMAWDAQRIACRSASHRDAAHPLRAHGRIGMACGVEYAAQAMALHGALVAGRPAAGKPTLGFLAIVRSVRLRALRLDDVQGDLICKAARVAGDPGTALYDFELWSDGASLLDGRATVVLDANERWKP